MPRDSRSVGFRAARQRADTKILQAFKVAGNLRFKVDACWDHDGYAMLEQYRHFGS